MSVELPTSYARCIHPYTPKHREILACVLKWEVQRTLGLKYFVVLESQVSSQFYFIFSLRSNLVEDDL